MRTCNTNHTIIGDPLPPPNKCDVCGSPQVRLIKRTKQKQAKYICQRCKASVYCHKNTDVPFGYMANDHTRYLRVKAHKAFDRLWLDDLMTRNAAYEWMARQIGTDTDHAHIARLSDNNLEHIITKSARQYDKLQAKAKRKKDKKNASSRRQRTNTRKGTRKGGGKWKPRPPSGSW